MTKTVFYIATIIVLLVGNLGLFFWDDLLDSTDTSSTFFEAEDLEQLSRVKLNANDSVSMEKTGQGWILNDQYRVDQNFFNTLISVLQRIEVVRMVPDWEGEVMGKAEIEYAFNSRYRFEFATNARRTKSYFIVNGEVFEVMVPGYRDLVVDIFGLHPDQWRDRLIIDGSWRSIQQVKIVRNELKPLTITFDDKFYLIDGNPAQDSTAVVDYLNQFQYFEANEMISKGRFEPFDSLSVTEPMATIVIDDFKLENPVRLEIFKSLKSQPYHLVMKENEMMVIDANRIQNLLATPERFLTLK